LIEGERLCGGLDPADVRRVIETALAEDLGAGPDVTTLATIPRDATGRADVVARMAGVVAGLPIAEAVFATVEPRIAVEHKAVDGERVGAAQVLMTVQGPLQAILTAERTVLNLLTHLSGIASVTALWADAVAAGAAGGSARVRDTRKTLPGLRALEKYAVRCGGGVNHRMSLGDAALIKDNHVAAAGSVTAAFEAVRTMAPDLPIEVECDTLDQVAEALKAGAGLILLDNFSVEEMRAAVELVRGRAFLEASGGLRLDQAGAVAATGVDFLSVGALTHSAPALDIGLDLVEAPDLAGPADAAGSAHPAGPADPADPASLAGLAEPAPPGDPAPPGGPVGPADPAGPAGPAYPVSPTDPAGAVQETELRRDDAARG
jgi:nicotinate-nucleotide pyrophosphorylase (carboxylating)